MLDTVLAILTNVIDDPELAKKYTKTLIKTNIPYSNHPLTKGLETLYEKYYKPD